MGLEYRILAVRNEGSVTVAALSPDQMTGPVPVQTLREDFQKLADEATTPVVLDLRPAERIEVSLLPEVLRFNRRLRERSLRLLVCASTSVREVLALARLDRVFDVAESYDGWPWPATSST
ncbi:MAG: hypothetical protein NUV77_23350 [Thermoguttaceae bacterium]|jgi:beta-phosphoglucomutase-like phosphatase (HAD superfamily)|nr:hypothetical protein [Thermoguttaceae bacterium]